MKIGSEHGFNGYFAGHRDGDFDVKLTPEEDADMKLLQVAIDRQTNAYGFGHLQSGLPSGLISYGPSESIKPRKKSELRFKPKDPLGETFESMIDFEESERPGETIYGTLFNIRDREIGPHE